MPLTFLVLKNIASDDKHNFSKFFSVDAFDSLVPDCIVSLHDRRFFESVKAGGEY